GWPGCSWPATHPAHRPTNRPASAGTYCPGGYRWPRRSALSYRGSRPDGRWWSNHRCAPRCPPSPWPTWPPALASHPAPPTAYRAPAWTSEPSYTPPAGSRGYTYGPANAPWHTPHEPPRSPGYRCAHCALEGTSPSSVPAPIRPARPPPSLMRYGYTAPAVRC